VNEAFRALDEEVAADETTIDDALRLGAGHPVGPCSWARSLGLARVVADLETLSSADSDTFRPSAGLRRAQAAQPPGRGPAG
ncbi:MAG: 3-hydroxyacyl-CoA dehydrogenase family protein, partial [Candidatus Limnocylindrales bacterium]